MLGPQAVFFHVEDLVVEYVSGTPVIHGISFSTKHGKKIGVVGRTSTGKSTLSLSFMRFIEATQGRIILNNVDISKIGLEDLRRNVTIIPQDPDSDAFKRSYLVHDSPTTSSTVSPVVEAADGECVVDRMSGIFSSLDADIKENGQNLSLVQRQLVTLARALVRRSRLIIMDEATASVDFDIGDRIQRTIRGAEFANSTLFCIAHRLRTIIDYDRILALDKDRAVEFNAPWNLLQREGGIFRGMCEKSGEYKHLVVAAQRKSQLTTASTSIQ